MLALFSLLPKSLTETQGSHTVNHNRLAACDAAILTGSQTGEAGGT
jgi:hypothetical protein